MGHVPMDRWEVEFCRFRGGNPVVEELQALRTKDVQLATEVVQDLKDLEGVRARPAREASAQDQGDRSVGVRTLWQHRIARSLFFEAGGGGPSLRGAF